MIKKNLKINVIELLKDKKYDEIKNFINKNNNLNLINIYSFNKNELIIFFNNILLKIIEKDFNNNINIDSFIYKYKSILENIYQLFNLWLNEGNELSTMNKIQIEEIEYLFQKYTVKYLKNNILNVSFSSQENFYQEIKKLNIFVNLYITTNHQFLSNITIKNPNFLLSKKLKLFLLESFLTIITINKEIITKNKIFINNLYYKHDGFKHLLPFYFYYMLFLLINSFDFSPNELNLKFKDNILNYIETVKSNPFYLHNLLADKTISIIISNLIIFNEYITKTLLEENNNLLFFDNKYKNKIIKINFYNLTYFCEELIGNKNLIQNIDKNFQNYNYINILYSNELKKILKQTFEIYFFNNKSLYLLNEFIEYNYNKNTKNSVFDDLLKLDININFYLNLYFLISIIIHLKKLNKNKNLSILSKEINTKNFENLIIKHTNNLNVFTKEKYNKKNFYNYELLNLYIILKINFNKKTFNKLINEIIYSIKFYKLKEFKLFKEFIKQEFLIDNSNIFYFILKTKLLASEEILELFDFNSLKKELDNNELLLIELILNIKNQNIKENKKFIEYVINSSDKNSLEIENALNSIGLKFKSRYIIN